MGILRTDRITGLGGANAIKGSAFFPQNSYINVSPDSGLDLSGDFTVEMWVYNLASPTIASHARQISSKNYYQAGSDGNWYFGLNRHSNTNFDITFYSYDGTGSAEYVNGSVGSDLEKWYHIAASRSGSTLKLFVDGVQKASGTLSKGLDDGGNNGLLIGGMSQSGGESSTWGDHYGYISNLRIIKGTALYTAAFTAPTFELSQTSDTTLLCCQSPGNVLQEKTGKIVSVLNHYGNTNSQGVIATRFTPNSPVGFSTTTDVGSQYGSTFDGFGSFATSTYMVPPGGNTRERNRGRAVFLGGGQPQTTVISFTQIQSMGNAQGFGSLTTSRNSLRGGSSSTRGLSAHSASTVDNTIEFVTIATQSNSTDFGDMSGSSTSGATGTNETRAVFWIGTNPSTNVIDFATIATTGNTSDFGDMSVGVRHIDTMNSSTRCVIPAGWKTSPDSNTNVIQYITFATTGNAQDFGDVDYTNGMRASGAFSSPTRGVFAGGADTPSNNAVNIIHFVTLASTGNSTDFGDISAAKRIEGGGTSSHTRGLIAGSNSPANINTIEFVTISTTGNSADFGDLMSSRSQDGYVGALSDCHGGLS